MLWLLASPGHQQPRYWPCKMRIFVWGLWRQKHVSQTWISNCIQQNTVGCNYLSMLEIPASGTKVFIFSLKMNLSNHRCFCGNIRCQMEIDIYVSLKKFSMCRVKQRNGTILPLVKTIWPLHCIGKILLCDFIALSPNCQKYLPISTTPMKRSRLAWKQNNSK